MKWENLGHRLASSLETRLLPLPRLIAGLQILTLPADHLEEELRRHLADNPFCQIATAPSRAAPLQEGWEEWLPAPITMDDHLRPQLQICPPLMRPQAGIVEGLLERLDDRGYLNVSLDELARFLKENETEAQETLQSLQDWVDPPGFFARDLFDCLLIQLRRQGRTAGPSWLLLTQGRNLLGKGEIQAAAKILGLSGSDLASALEELRSLDPHPGRAFSSKEPLTPEILFAEEGGAIRVRLIEENLPRLVLDEKMLPWLMEESLRPAWAGFQETLGLLARRYRTKLRLALFLANCQKGYLLKRQEAPSPLILKEAASELGLHPSTIQRTSVSTWTLSSSGTLPLSALFSRPLRSRPDISVAGLRKTLLQGMAEGKSYAAIARELGIPRRTAAWHGKALKGKKSKKSF